MARPGGAAQKARKRAMKVSLRTFQRVPNVVADTEDGEPIVDVGGVRLVLPEGANHFRRLVECSRCGRESVGDPVLSAANLGPSRLIFCDECSSGSVEFDLAHRGDIDAEPGLIQDETGIDAITGELEPLQPVAIEASDGDEGDTSSASLAEYASAVQDAFLRHQEQLDLRVGARFAQTRRDLSERLDQAVTGQEAAFTVLGSTLHEGLKELQEADAGALERTRRDLSERLDQAVAAQEAAFTVLESTLTDGLKEQHEAHMRAVETSLVDRHRQLVEQLATALGERLDQHRQLLDAAIGSQLEQRHQQLTSQLAVALGDRLEQHRRSLESTLSGQLEQGGQRVVSELQTAVSLLDQRTTEILVGLGRRLVDGLSQVEQTVIDRGDRQREGRTREVLAIVNELEEDFRDSQDGMYRRLDELAERAGASGSMQLALLQAMGERFGGSLAAMASQLVRLQGDLSVAQQGIAELRGELQALRSLATVPAPGVGHEASVALFAGLGVASPAEHAAEGDGHGEVPPAPRNAARRVARSTESPRKAAATKNATVNRAAAAATVKKATAKKAPAKATAKKAPAKAIAKKAPAKATAKKAPAKATAKKAPAMRAVVAPTKATGTKATATNAAPRKAATTAKATRAPAEPVRKPAATKRTATKLASTGKATTGRRTATGAERSVVKARLATARRALESWES